MLPRNGVLGLVAVGCLIAVSGCSDDSTAANDNNSNPPVCGNDQQEGTEQCDGADLDSQTCLTRGFASGDLGCASDCQFNETQCETSPECGDGTIEAPEQCDGANLDSQTCASQGFDGGTLACAAGCLFDTTGCSECGDGVLNGTEACDGSDLGTATCVDETGFTDGILACTATCTIDTSGCYTCGDGVLDGPEACDGSVGSETCQSQAGLAQGSLTCDASCLAFDTADCFECGNGVIEGAELCDGVSLAGETCQNQTGLADGALACDGSCQAYDTSSCYANPLANGQPCQNGSECLSGNCPLPDGVCCDDACAGTCEACTAAKTCGTDGICALVVPGSDPDNECPTGDCFAGICNAGNVTFVTSGIYSGNFGGLTGADSICQSHAAAACLQGTFMAWLSTNTESPNTRFTQSAGAYRLVDGTMVANNYNDLTDYTLDVPLNLDEFGNPPPISTLSGGCEADVAWSGTNADGTPANTSSERCNDWTTTVADGSWGRYSQTTSLWSQYCTGSNGLTCQLQAPLYCFEQ